MLVFCEIVAFETPHHDTKVDGSSALIAIFSNPEGVSEATTMSRGFTHFDRNGGKYMVFTFNRPFTRHMGERLVVQVIQFFQSGAQSLIGYGYCDLNLDVGEISRDFKVSLWRPRSESEVKNRYRGTFTPFVDAEYVTLPPEIERERLRTISSLGKVKIHLQRATYH